MSLCRVSRRSDSVLCDAGHYTVTQSVTPYQEPRHTLNLLRFPARHKSTFQFNFLFHFFFFFAIHHFWERTIQPLCLKLFGHVNSPTRRIRRLHRPELLVGLASATHRLHLFISLINFLDYNVDQNCKDLQTRLASEL